MNYGWSMDAVWMIDERWTMDGVLMDLWMTDGWMDVWMNGRWIIDGKMVNKWCINDGWINYLWMMND